MNAVEMTDPRIAEFLTLWHENGRSFFTKSYPNLDYDSASYAKTAKDRNKFIALDNGASGVFLIEKATGNVWSIKGYGRKNRIVGTLDSLIARYRDPNARNAGLFARR